MTDSIRIQMIPGSALNLDKKTFNWTVEAFDEEHLRLKFKFDNPLFIS